MSNPSEDSLDRDRIEEIKKTLRMSHGAEQRRADPGRKIVNSAPSSLEEKLSRMEKRTEAGEQALRVAPRNGLGQKIKHARTTHRRPR